MSDDKTRTEHADQEAPDLAGSRPKVTLEVEAVQIVDEEPAKAKPPPLPAQRPAPAPPVAPSPKGGRGKKKGPPPLKRKAGSPEVVADAAAAASGLSDLTAALSAAADEGGAGAAQPAGAAAASGAADQFAKKLTAEAEAVTPTKPAPCDSGSGDGSPPGQHADRPVSAADSSPALGQACAVVEDPAAQPQAGDAEQGSTGASPAGGAEDAAAHRAAAADDQAQAALQSESHVRYALADGSIPWHKLDYREAALLAQVDGTRDRAAVIAAAELGAETGGQLFAGLVERGLIREVED